MRAMLTRGECVECFGTVFGAAVGWPSIREETLHHTVCMKRCGDTVLKSLSLSSAQQTYTCTHTHIHTFSLTHIHTFTHTYTRTYTRILTHTHTHIHIHIHTHSLFSLSSPASATWTSCRAHLCTIAWSRGICRYWLPLIVQRLLCRTGSCCVVVAAHHHRSRQRFSSWTRWRWLVLHAPSTATQNSSSRLPLSWPPHPHRAWKGAPCGGVVSKPRSTTAGSGSHARTSRGFIASPQAGR